MWAVRVTFLGPKIKGALGVRALASKPQVTALYDFHVENGGKMVDFGGYLLPVQYSDLGISASHIHTRQKASLFDVSHMLQTEMTGPACIDVMETICTADLRNLSNSSSVLTVFTNSQGGILDDLIVTKIAPDHLYIVSNAAMKIQDQKIIQTAVGKHKNNVKAKFFDPMERSLVALQGPLAAKILQNYTRVDLSKLFFMTSVEADVCQVGACRITRCGYTGEDGFEISVPSMKIADVCREFCKHPDVKLAGLGARDSLRLEAGLCLYGNDIGPETTPIEAALTWLVAKNRRLKSDFSGATKILQQIKDGCATKRVGVVAEASGPPARHGALILSKDGRQIGHVTSGCPAPTLQKNIAMAYVPAEFSKVGTPVAFKIRDKLYNANIAKMPFVPSHYYSKPKN